MRGTPATLLVLGLALVLAAGAVLLGPAADGPPSGLVVFTEIPAPQGNAAVDWLYPDAARIAALDPDAPGRAPVVLTEGFRSARAPEISFDGRRVLFAGLAEGDDAWQAWEMNLDGSGLRRRTRCPAGCTDPAYLPHDGIVYRARLPESPDRHALFTLDEHGTEQRITFHPNTDGAPGVLQDGRILSASSASVVPTAVLAMRYDGTRADPFYLPDSGRTVPGKMWETSGREAVFVEANAGDTGGTLVQVFEGRPLHSRVELAPDLPPGFHSAVPEPEGRLTASFRASDDVPFALFTLDPREQTLEPLYEDAGFHAVEPVRATPRPEPAGFVSIVDEQTEAGWIYGLDADHSTLPPHPGASGPSRLLQVHTPEGPIGTAPLAADGSFYIEIPPDTPLRFLTTDAGGRTVRGPSAWIWVRPNEQRGCVGCHEDRELTPANRVPDALNGPPVDLRTTSTDPLP